jgi:hypothetical protein
MCLEKIDIGAVYSAKVRLLIKSVFFFQIKFNKKKIFQFSGADICSKCWTLMRFAMQIIDRALHGLFDFKIKIKSNIYL